MNVSPITVLAPNGSAPAPREPAQSGDLFGDLLAGPASRVAREPVVPPGRTESRPAPAAESKPADRPAPKANDGDVAAGARKSDAEDGNETAPRGDTEQAAAKDKGQTETDANSETDSGGEEAAQAPANAAASEVAAAVLALITSTETRAPAEVGALAANTAVTAAAAAGTPAVTVKPAVTAKPVVAGAVPELAAEEPAGDTPQASAKNGLGPVQVTVTDEGKILVSRPATTLAAANVQDFADAPVQPQPQPQPQAADPETATTLNAAIAPDERAATQGQSGKDGGGKTAPVPDSALNLAAKTAETIEVSPPARQAADKPVPQIQTPALHPAVAAPVYAAANQTAAPAPNVVLAQPPMSPAVTGANIDHVALQIGKAAADGLDRISIQLKPEAMGRIDVQLQVHSDGRVHAVIAADRQDTLDLLQRDARSLERALNDAGLRADAGSLSFNLNGRGRDDGTDAPPASAQSYANGPDAGAPQPVPAALIAAYNAAAARGGVDIRV